MSSWQMQDIARICRADWQGPAQPGQPVTSLAIDHRQLGDNGLFIALPGARHDGHDFVSRLSAGRGQGAIVRHPVQDAPVAQLVVSDPLKALHSLARSNADQLPAAKIAITGSVGKTGTKEMLARCLSGFGPTHASPGNFNNHIGAPLSIANAPEDARFVVAEMGMNHAGEIALLADIFSPQIALITKIAASHAGHFDRLEDIADAKAEIFSGFTTGGTAILPGDDDFFDRLAGAARLAGADRIISFGQHERCDIRLVSQQRQSAGQLLEIEAYGQKITLKLGMQAAHWGQNAAGVIAVAAGVGLDLHKAADQLAGMGDLPGRGASFDLVIEGHKCLIIDDAYNAGPASMQAALRDFASRPGQNRALILSDMLELGALADQAHDELAPLIRAAGVQSVLLIGKKMARLAGQCPVSGRIDCFDKAEDAFDRAAELAGSADVILIKGSHGSAAYKLADHLARLAGRGDR